MNKLLALVVVLGLVLTVSSRIKAQSAGNPSAQAKKVCITDVVSGPNDEMLPLGPCRIVASVPFFLSDDDYATVGRMLMAAGNAERFIQSEQEAEKMQRSDTALRELVTGTVTDFQVQRKIFCSRQPYMAVFDFQIAGDKHETSPQPCSNVR